MHQPADRLGSPELLTKASELVVRLYGDNADMDGDCEEMVFTGHFSGKPAGIWWALKALGGL